MKHKYIIAFLIAVGLNTFTAMLITDPIHQIWFLIPCIFYAGLVSLGVIHIFEWFE